MAACADERKLCLLQCFRFLCNSAIFVVIVLIRKFILKGNYWQVGLNKLPRIFIILIIYKVNQTKRKI